MLAAWNRADTRDHPDDGALSAPPSPLEQAGHEDHIVNITALEPQVGFLRAAGFEGIDVYWRRLDAVIYGGRRPLSEGADSASWKPGRKPPG